jgi:hypothetical protein
VIGLLIVVGIGAASALWADDAGPSPSPTVGQTATLHPSPKSTTAKSRAMQTDPLTGGAVNDNPVIAVKVENITAARPQVACMLLTSSSFRRSRAGRPG